MSLRIKATITLNERDDDEHYSSGTDLAETQIDLRLPVPDPTAIAPYLAQQIAGFLELAGVQIDTREATADEAEAAGRDPGMRDTGEPMLVPVND